MEFSIKKYCPWNSLPTAFSRLQTASSLRDSSCTSDDVSDISLTTTNTTITNISSTLPDLGIPIPHIPKQHFKFQSSIQSLNNADFGYESDDSRVESAEHVEFSERFQQYPEDSLQGDEIFAFEDCHYDPLESTVSPYDAYETGSEFEEFEEFDEVDEALDEYVDDMEFDDSHIAFENFVHFDTDVSYIENVEHPDDHADDEAGGQSPMTLHEMMLLANSRRDHVMYDSQDGNNDDSGNGDTSIANIIIQQLAKDYASDMLDVDKQIFVAFINGIHGDTKRRYQSYLHDRVQGFREGRFQSPFFETETDSSGCLFLDEALKHVIGMFRHIVLREEFDELARLAQSSRLQEQVSASTKKQSFAFLERIERLLSERLLQGMTSVGQDELSFFADGVVYALAHPNIYAYDVAAI
ncbi:hypothetical protein UA08_00458 [Talaromyces atroroseus]|uniref:Uncharacterized protein n=1 Tax=Talaromyces atroroseus TaxID=1441469 RepID=A0A225B2E2_TALAT|nr:hypothetical protein UA08_00458 [Talaromyces atroroseus]OKL63888.1 hypothetical protein UA08_00458 [Talaromyces atroroseus]